MPSHFQSGCAILHCYHLGIKSSHYSMILIILHVVRLFKCGQSGWLHRYHLLWVLPRDPAFSYPWTSLSWTLPGSVLSQSCARLGTDSDHGSPLQVETVDDVIKEKNWELWEGYKQRWSSIREKRKTGEIRN